MALGTARASVRKAEAEKPGAVRLADGASVTVRVHHLALGAERHPPTDVPVLQTTKKRLKCRYKHYQSGRNALQVGGQGPPWMVATSPCCELAIGRRLSIEGMTHA